MENENQGPEEENQSAQGLPKKFDWKGITAGIAQIMGPVTNETFRMVAIFLLVVVFAIGVVALTPSSRVPAIIALVLIAATFIGVIVTVWFRNAPTTKKSSRRTLAPRNSRTATKIIATILIVIIFIIASLIVDRLDVIPKAFPRLFPEFAATQSLRAHFDSLSQLLRASTDEAIIKEFVNYSSSTTARFQQELFKSNGHNVTQLLDDYANQKQNNSADLLSVAKNFKEAYGKIDMLFVEFTTPTSWRKIKLGAVHEVLFQGIVRYEGKFTYNKYTDLPNITVSDFSKISDVNSILYKELSEWMAQTFTGFSKLSSDEKSTIIRSIKANELAKPQAIDVMLYRNPTLEAIQPAAFREGRELIWFSIEMQNEKPDDKNALWKVAQLAVWGQRRMFFNPS